MYRERVLSTNSCGGAQRIVMQDCRAESGFEWYLECQDTELRLPKVRADDSQEKSLCRPSQWKQVFLRSCTGGSSAVRA